MSKYFISCFSGARNIGDELILHCLVDMVRSVDKNSRIIVTSLNPAYTSSINNNIDAIEWKDIGYRLGSIKNFINHVKSIKKVDYVIIGGGGLLQDVHSLNTIPRYLISAIIGKFFRKKVFYFCLGIGPINNNILIKIVRDISNNFIDCITVRDENSKDYLRRIGVQNPIHVFSDPVFCVSDLIKGYSNTHNRQIKLGLCFRQFKLNKDLELELEKLIIELSKKNKYEIILFPFDIDEDISLCNRLKEKTGTIKVVDNYDTPKDLVLKITELDYMISMRLHGVIASASYGIPSIAISYDMKVSSIQNKVGMGYFTIELSEFSAEECMKKLKELESNFSNIKPYFVSNVQREKQIVRSGFKYITDNLVKSKKTVNRFTCILYIIRLIYPLAVNKIRKCTSRFFTVLKTKVLDLF